MQEFGLPCMKAKISSLIIFPKDIEEIEKQILENIFEPNTAQIENTFLGIFFNIIAHKHKKSILLSSNIFGYSGSFCATDFGVICASDFGSNCASG